MLKKTVVIPIIIVFALLTCGLFLAGSDDSDATETYTKDGLTYTLYNKGGDDNTCEVTSINRNALPADLTIPKFIEYNEEKYRLTAVNAVVNAYTSNIVNLVIEDNPGLVFKANFITNNYTLKTVTIGEGVNLSNSMFMMDQQLETVTLPQSLEVVPSGAFQSCSKLTTCNLGPNVKEIQANAFSGCSKLTGVTLPDSLEIIGNSAFQNCSSIENLTLGPNVKSLGASPFKGTNLQLFMVPATVTELPISTKCFLDDLEAVVIAKDNPAFTVENGVLYNKDKSTLLYYPRNMTTVDGTFTTSANIGPYAFYKTMLTKIVITDGAKTIGDGAFNSSPNLKELVIADSVTSIGAGAFGSASKLAKINIPAGITDLPEGFFKGCTSLREMTVPATITTINKQLFLRCSGLETVTILGDVTSIGNSAFQSCTSLKTVNLPATVTTIGEMAFMRCSSLETINLPDSVTVIEPKAFQSCTSLKITSLPASLQKLGVNAFNGCTELKITALPSNLTELGAGCLYNTGIESITLGDSTAVSITDGSKGLTQILGGPALKSVTLNKVECDYEAGWGTIVYLATNLEQLNLGPDFTLWQWDDSGLGVNAEKKTAYLVKPGVTKVTIPTTVEKFYGRGFQDNAVLEELDFAGENTRTITFETSLMTSSSQSGSDFGMFQKCVGLKKVTLPHIILVNNEVNTFMRCSSLQEVEIWSLAQMPNNFFFVSQTPSLSKVILHSCPVIKNAFGCATYVQMPDDLTSIAGVQNLKGSDGEMIANNPSADVINSEIKGKLFIWTGEKGTNATSKIKKAVTDNDVIVKVYDGSKIHYALTAKDAPMSVGDYVIFGMDIDKWYTDADKTQLYAGSDITESVTFYPSMVSADCVVTFPDMDGLVVTNKDTNAVLHSGDIVPSGTNILISYGPVDNVSVGVRFYYPVRDETGGGTTTLNQTSFTKTITEATEVRVTVTKIDGIKLVFDTTGGSTIDTIEGKCGETYQKPADPTKPGFLFAGWDQDLPDVLPVNNSWNVKTYTYKAIWAPDMISILFDSNGGESVASVERMYNTMFQDLPVAVREGHSFLGWFDAAEGGNQIEYETVFKSTEDYTVYAHWEVLPFTLSFVIDPVNDVRNITQDYGTAVSAPSDVPATSGSLSFLGWDAAVPATMPAVDMVIRAVYGKVAVADANGAVDIDLSGAENFSVPAGVTGGVKADLGERFSVVVPNGSALAGKTVTAKVAPVTNDSDIAGTAYEFTFEQNGEAFNGPMQVTVPYTAQKGTAPAVYFWNGTASEKMTVVSYTDDTVTFETEHNSVYIVGNQAVDESDDHLMIYIAIAAVLAILAVFAVFTVKRRA